MRLLTALIPLLSLPALAEESVPLGVKDTGIFSDLDGDVQVALPPTLDPTDLAFVVDRKHDLLLLYRADLAVKVYPLGGEAALTLGGDVDVELRPQDQVELAPYAARPARVLGAKERPPGGDADGDGIPNLLDLLIGAKKVAKNGASYGAGYMELSYPNGDVPRDQGVCTDVVIRAARNAGIDLQKELHVDIKKARKAYPMVKRPNASIDQRRVRTLLPYFKRHWEAHGTDPADADDPFLPGDVVLLDTLSKAGPDHIGIVSDTLGPSGLPLIVNNWTDGYTESEMDLLDFVPVTHRFRAPAK